MAQKEYILQELNELKSTLASCANLHTYTVPAGYFEGLIEQVMRRIKALDAATAADELDQLSVLLASLSRQMPYSVPAGYFEGLAEQVLRRIKAMEAATVQDELNELSPLLAGLSKKMPFEVPAGYFNKIGNDADMADKETAAAELASLSPLLGGMKKDMPYAVPAGYFENLAAGIINETKPKAKVVGITSRSWFRYAAAAVVTGVIATLAFIRFSNNEIKSTDSIAKIEKKINKDLKKMSEQDLNDFLQFNAAGLDGTENVKSGTVDEAKELLKDVSESEMKTFLEETADVEPDTETIMLN